MIAAADPVDFIPSGRSVIAEHCGPLTKKNDFASNEFILLDRMQNVNLSVDEHFNESWVLREVLHQNLQADEEDLAFLTPCIVNSEEELYFSGHTAVWSRGREKSSADICYTTENPILFAEFCSPNFLNPDYKIDDKEHGVKSSFTSIEDNQGIAIIDCNSLKVYSRNGENIVSSLECPVRKIWKTKYCILIEKDASMSVVEGHSVPMPRYFSLTHPLDEMFPVLLKSQNVINFIVEDEYKIIFTLPESDLVLMFNSTTARHLVCKLRKVTDEEAESTAFLHDGSNMAHTSIGGFNSINQQHSMKASTSRHNVSGRHTPNAPGANLYNSPNQHHSSANYRMNLASFADSGLHKNSISMVARKIGECNPSKALVPDLILEQLWSENNGNWNEFHETATKGFMHTDFIGQQYLCFLLSRSFKLNLLCIEQRKNSLQMPIFGSVTTITAKDAVCLAKMNMIVALLPCGTLMLYSGPVAVGKIYVGGILSNLSATSSVTALSTPAFPKRSSILPNIPSPMVDQKLTEQFHMLSPVQPLHSNQNQLRLNNCTSIKDPVGNRVSVGFTNGKIYRFQLPFMCENQAVRQMLIALRQVLPKECLKVFVRWYSIKNSPGTRDLNLKREFELFKVMLYELIGRPHEVSSSSSSTTINAKKRRKNEENGADSDWEYLMNVTEDVMTEKKNEDDGDQDMIQNYHTDAPLFPNIPAIFYTMHLLYEDFKMDLTMKTEMKLISEFLCQLATDFKLELFRFHYIKDNSKLCFIKSKREISTSGSELLLRKELIGTPLSIFQEIANLTCKTKFEPYPFIPNVNNSSKDIYEILAVIFEKVKMPNDASVLVKVSDNQMTSFKNTSKIPPGSIQKIVIDTMIKKGITRKKMERLPVAIHYIISQILETVRLNPPLGSCAKAYKLLLRPELFTHAAFKRNRKCLKEVAKVQHESSLSLRIQTQPDVIAKSEKALVEDDGMEQIDTKLLRLRFPDDLRINDVKKFLNSSKPVTIDITQAPNMSDHDFIEEQEKQLFALCTRTMALPVGRGMFTFRTYYPVLTETLPIPKLCLSGKEINRGATVELQSIELPANMSVWPQFHNGVASALRIATDSTEIDPAYIMYNKPKDSEMPPSYAGFLMALGLTSSLKSLSDTYIYDYLVKSEELLSVGLILGMAASYRGTMDTKVTRMLSIHIESLLPPTAIELDVPHNVQVASLLGIGLLYQNSNKRYIAEALLQEINRPPGPEMENYVERESYSLAAGLALGMVCLETGNKDVGLDDLNLPDTLHYYMVGGTKRGLIGAQRDKYKLPSFQIREGDQVNIDVTSPGATLALGLMFFGSGNQAVADWMKPPETMFLLDFVRPDLLLMRVIARGLIMWHSVEPTAEWINSQISKTLSRVIKNKPDPENDPLDLDHEAICQAYCNIVTGAAMVIGLRFAGTENLIAFKTLKKIITFFLSANGQYIGEYAGKASVESCIVVVLIATSLVFAGTGNLEILRMIRMTRSRIGPQNSSVTYGSHMAIHMALGFLFLGAGRYTISRRPQAIAALICALFPKFPNHSNDNRYHLQALRHLYVLAVEPRLFLPRDIDSGKLVVCKLTYLEFNKKSVIETMAPSMLPELETLRAVYINDPNYWPVTFERGRNWNQLIEILKSNDCIDIVQKAGCLSHLDDPNRLKSLLAQTLTTEKHSSWKVEPMNLHSFYNDHLMVTFSKIIMKKNQSGSSRMCDMILLQIYDCLTRDKTHALGLYLAIDNIIETIVAQQNVSSIDLWQVKILNFLMKKRHFQENLNGDSSSLLLSPELLNSLLVKIRMKLDEAVVKHKDLLKKLMSEQNLNFIEKLDTISTEQLLQLATYTDVPLHLSSNSSSQDISQMNLLQFLFEFKKHHLHLETDFISNLWKIMKC